MVWKSFVSPHAIMSRRRFTASALVYGLSLTVRFTSTTGEETEAPPQVAQSNPMSAIMTDGGAGIFKHAFPTPAQPFAFHFGWPAGPGGCRAVCEGPMPMSVMPICAPHP